MMGRPPFAEVVLAGFVSNPCLEDAILGDLSGRVERAGAERRSGSRQVMVLATVLEDGTSPPETVVARSVVERSSAHDRRRNGRFCSGSRADHSYPRGDVRGGRRC
jgi:hypothetical protein